MNHSARIYGAFIEWSFDLTQARVTLDDGRTESFASEPNKEPTAHWQALQWAKKPPAVPVVETAPAALPATQAKRGK